MEIEFEKSYLKELYIEGKAKSKKKRFQKPVIKQYKKTIDILRASNRIEDLYLFATLNYKKLTGDKQGLESVRVNNKYRIEFKSRMESVSSEVITICSIVELSNHYK